MPLSPCLFLIAQADDFSEHSISFFDRFPGLKDILILAATAVLVYIIYRFVKGSSTPLTGFVIQVDGDNITFNGQFPAHMQPTVANFLRDDVAAPTPYEVRGHWEERILVIVVKGQDAKIMEQRIRNFMKLNLKKPS